MMKSERRLALVTAVMAAFLISVNLASAAQTTTRHAPAKKGMKAAATKTSGKVKGASPKASSSAQAPKPNRLAESVPVGTRDPFDLPKPAKAEGKLSEVPPSSLPSGTRGLVIGQLKVEGIVREDNSNTMIAVVTGRTNLAYFLRESDPVYDGVVSKITPDSVYFKENYLDEAGRMNSREVIKRLAGAPGEKQ